MPGAGDRKGESSHREAVKWHRVWLLRFLSASIGVAVVVVLAELTLWLLPVTDTIPYWPLEEDNDVMRYQPNQQFVWSRGWRLRQAHLIETNNLGFVSDTDYAMEGERPVLAFVGDSYVEALMVAYPATCAGRLARAFEGRVRVYSLGMSGAPLSEYLGYAEFARRRFAPRWLVVVVVGNDFDESLRQYRRGDQFRSFVDHDGKLRLVPGRPRAARPGYRGFKRFVKRSSSLVRYFRYNVQVLDRYHIAEARVVGLFRDDAAVSAVRSAKASHERSVQSRRAIDAFLTLLPGMSGIPEGRTLFVLDGIRPALYDPRALDQAERGYYGRMRTYFAKRALDRGYQVADMQSAFIARHRVDQTRFEWEHDGHWNSLGHQVCFDEVMRLGFPDLRAETQQPPI